LIVPCALALLMSGPIRVRATDAPSPGLYIAAAPSADDCRLTLLALEALSQDEQLAAMNLGLTVHDNVLTLWGPVPSAAVAARAVEVTRQVPGLGGVINQLTVLPPEDYPLPSNPPPARRPGQASVRGPRPGSGLAARPETHAPIHGDGLLWPRPVPLGRSPATAPGLADAAGGTSPGPSARLGAPIPVLPPMMIRTPAPPQAPVRLTTVPVPSPAVNEIAGLDRLVQADPRYRQLRPEVRGRDVYLHGVVYSLVDLHAAARAVSQLPGVGRVVLDDVRVVGGR
jgi:osmotically-inducible protein OsmY